MNALDIAVTLKKEADTLLQGQGLDRLFRSYGTVFYTGSYFLNLMAWRDIDIHLVLEPDPHSLEQFWALGLQISQVKGVFRSNFLNTLRHPGDNLPAGYCWGVRLEDDNGCSWKLDIWASDESDLNRNQMCMERVATALTEDTRRLIVETKQALMLPEGHTPWNSGFHIYEAVLVKGLRDLDVIRSYLREQGIEGV